MNNKIVNNYMVDNTYNMIIQKDILNYFSNVHNLHTKYDNPEPWGLFFQDNATPQMEALEELHNNIMFYLAIIMFAVT
jgi:cytochrome c oxidase subunit 2